MLIVDRDFPDSQSHKYEKDKYEIFSKIASVEVMCHNRTRNSVSQI
jgi:hypothetical protein